MPGIHGGGSYRGGEQRPSNNLSTLRKGDRDETFDDRDRAGRRVGDRRAGLGADVRGFEPAGAQPPHDDDASPSPGPARACRGGAAALCGAGLSLLSLPVSRLRLLVSLCLLRRPLLSGRRLTRLGLGRRLARRLGRRLAWWLGRRLARRRRLAPPLSA